MRRFFFVASFVASFVVLAPAGTVTLKWRAETSQAQSYQATVYRGETARLEAQLLSYGAALALPSNATASIYYQTNGMADAWWIADAAATTNGVVSADFTPEMDAGASRYVFFLGVSGDGANYRANGVLNIRHAPGATPNALALPAPFIDFSTVTVSNSPWATPADVAEAVDAIVEADPVAYPVATTALALAEGALTTEADTLATVTARGATTTNAVTLGSMTIGARKAGEIGTGSFFQGWHGNASGAYSTSIGGSSEAVGEGSFAFGYRSIANADDSMALGILAEVEPADVLAFVWQGLDGYSADPLYRYTSHGPGTFNINPVGGLAGLWIGETPLSATLAGYATTEAVAAATNWVESIRGIHADIATNVVYHVVVSNGHWLIREVE